ncbi:insulinase family protein [Glaciecola siphonariae]|uniref:Insulinase family protein n=1 Tax=Glaciecola siphonariae TaxID=521012 RepID=A0ABV9LT90_9ALTE
MYLLKSTDQNLVVETLPNGLKLAIIRSDATPVPIVSVSVAAGQYHETTQCYGFSHLLEHMIFHRSKRGEHEDALEKHVASQGGYINGWTHACHTNFHLSCHQSGFISALKMLWNKITHPSFSIDGIKSEIAAIEQEFRLKQQDPVRGLFSVKKAIANQAHPFHRFTVGNAQTFSKQSLDELQSSLIEHHENYFHSGNIAVCIKLPRHDAYNDLPFDDLPFNDLLGQAKHILSAGIAEKPANHALQLPALYTQDMQNIWVNLRVKHSYCQLVLCWLVDKQDEVVDAYALKMLRKQFESKHKQGVFDIFAMKKWIRAITFTGGIEQDKCEELQLHLTLSPSGAKNKENIIALVTGYIRFLGQSQLANWRFNELEKQENLFAKYGNKRDPIEACIETAQSLHEGNNKSDNSSLPQHSFHQAKTRIQEIVRQMAESIHHVYFIDEHAAVDKTTEFYDVPYSVQSLPSISADTQTPFMLAPQNAYVSAQLLMVTPELPSGTVKVFDNHGVKLKFAQVIKDSQPCGDCFISVNSPAMCATLEHTVSKKIWVEALEKYLQRRFYQATDAGIAFRVYGHQHGLTIHTTGFSDKQLMLCIEIVNCMIAFRLNRDEFDHGKEVINKRLSNSLVQKPINQMFANLNTLIQGDTFSIKQQVNAVKSLAFETLNAHQGEFFQKVCVEALMVGNWRLFAAQRMHQQLQGRLTAKSLWQKPKITANYIEQGCLPKLHAIDSTQTALVLYQQLKEIDDGVYYLKEHATAICLMLEHILSPHVFLRLRNEQQLAYLVGAGYKPINAQAGIAIYLQSSEAGASQLYRGIMSVIEQMLDNWEETEEEIEQARPRVIEQCKPLDKDIASTARRLWANFDSSNGFYDYKRLQASIANVSGEDLKHTLAKLMHPGAGQALLTNDTQAASHEDFAHFTHRPNVQ